MSLVLILEMTTIETVSRMGSVFLKRSTMIVVGGLLASFLFSGEKAWAASGKRSPGGLRRLTYDLGASSGSVGNVSYSEADLGFNAYFQEWLVWRNALFARFPSGGSSFYGYDTSVRAVLDISGKAGGFTGFAGPGLRFASRGLATAPFLEGGVVFRLAGLSLGGGVKGVMNSWMQAGASNDTQFFLILAGGGAL